MSKRCDITHIWVAGIDRKCRNVVRIFQADMLELRAAVGRPIHAVSP